MFHTTHRATGRQDKVTIFGVFAILALLPTAFSVAFEFDATGLTSGRTWLVALLPMLLLVACRFIPTVWHRSRIGRWNLLTVATIAGLGFMWHLIGLFGFLAANPSVGYLAPVALAGMYAGFGLFIGRAHTRPTGGHSAGVRVPITTGPVGRPETFSRR